MSFGYIFNKDTCARVETAEQPVSVPDTKIEIISYEKLAPTGEDRLVFDLVNAPPAYANALRRCLLSWVPSIAIEDVCVCDNTGIVPDELLAHRLGLIPLNVRPSFLDAVEGETDPESKDPHKTILLGLHVMGGEGPEPNLEGVESSWEGKMPPFYTGPSGMVLSDHLVWMPFPEQIGVIPRFDTLHKGVPIAKLRPGQRIELYARAVKSNGLDHAKYQPVATAFYRLVPRVEVSEAINRRAKELLVEKCPMKVFDIEDEELVIRDVRKCTACRECINTIRLSTYVTVGKEAGRFEFTVESVGVVPAPELVSDALKMLQQKCEELKQAVDEAART